MREPLSADEIERFVDAASAALDLRIAAEHRPGVLRYFAIAAGMAAIVDGLPLATSDESGAVFVPVAPKAEA